MTFGGLADQVIVSYGSKADGGCEKVLLQSQKTDILNGVAFETWPFISADYS